MILDTNRYVSRSICPDSLILLALSIYYQRGYASKICLEGGAKVTLKLVSAEEEDKRLASLPYKQNKARTTQVLNIGDFIAKRVEPLCAQTKGNKILQT